MNSFRCMAPGPDTDRLVVERWAVVGLVAVWQLDWRLRL